MDWYEPQRQLKRNQGETVCKGFFKTRKINVVVVEQYCTLL